MKGTRIFGDSDDNVYIEGEISGQESHFGTDDSEYGITFLFSDGTFLEVKYGKKDLGVWQIKIIRKGSLFDRIEECNDEDADIYSDIVYFKEGIKYAFACQELINPYHDLLLTRLTKLIESEILEWMDKFKIKDGLWCKWRKVK